MMRALRLAVYGLAFWAVLPMTGITASPEVLTLEEAAAFLRVNQAELGQLAAWGQVPGRRIGAQWRFSRGALLAWLGGDYTAAGPAGGGYIAPPVGLPAAPLSVPAPTALIPAAPPPLPPAALALVTGRGTAGAPSDETSPIGEAPEAETADDIFLRDQRLLLGAGDVTLELGLFYARSDEGDDILGVVVERDSFISTFTARYGLLPDTELFAGGSFSRTSSQTFAGQNELASTADTGFGDVTLGVRETVIHEALGVPDVILTLEGGIPTGDSSWSLGGGVALVKSFDPVVLFANANYSHVFARDFADISLLEAENRIDSTLGFAFALNDTLTLSTAVSGLFTDETAFTGATLRQRESFSLQFGLTTLLASGFYIEPSVSFNLNGEGNDVVLGVSMPYTFAPGF